MTLPTTFMRRCLAAPFALVGMLIGAAGAALCYLGLGALAVSDAIEGETY